MKFSELFYTIQGEGKFVGVPSVFFRTSYCKPEVYLVRHRLYELDAGEQRHICQCSGQSNYAVWVQAHCHHGRGAVYPGQGTHSTESRVESTGASHHRGDKCNGLRAYCRRPNLDEPETSKLEPRSRQSVL